MRLKTAIVLSVAAMAAVAGAWLILPPAQTWKLPDGSVLELAKVTYGTKHEVRCGNRWQDYLAPFLSASQRLKYGSRVAVHTSANTNAVVLWFWRKIFPGAPSMTPVQLYNPMTLASERLVAVDEHGLESAILESPNLSRLLTKQLEVLEAWELPDYPRRDRKIKLRIYAPWGTNLVTNSRGSARSEPVGRLTISNPFRSHAPIWLPEALPATRRTNGWEISLERVETGVQAPPDLFQGADYSRFVVCRRTLESLDTRDHRSLLSFWLSHGAFPRRHLWFERTGGRLRIGGSASSRRAVRRAM